MDRRSASFVVIAVLAAAVLFVTPIVAYKTVNVDFSEFEALMNFNGKVNKGSSSECCEDCMCDNSEPSQCQCMDWFEGGCPSECGDKCICMKIWPPRCRCMATKSECPVKECPTLKRPYY